MPRTYEIRPRAESDGGGWNIKFFFDGQEAGAGAFPIPDESPNDGIAWWNGLTEDRRAHWLMMSASAMPAAARQAYLLAEAYNDALDKGEAWIGR